MTKKVTSILFAYCLWFSVLMGTFAQSPELVRKGDKNEASYLRTWIVSFSGAEAVSIFVQGPQDPKPRKLSSASDGEQVMNLGYTKFIAGIYQFELKIGDKVLQNMTADLAENSAFSLLAWSEGSKWNLRVFADGPFAENVKNRPLRLLNFADNRETLIALDGGEEKKVAANTVEEFNSSVKLTSFTVKVLSPDGGAPAQSSGEVDFVTTPSAYVIISPDYRGRMRPRVVAGGYFAGVEE